MIDSTPVAAQATGELHCAGCGAAGHPPVIVYDERQRQPGAVLTPVFDWHADGRPALLCGACRRGWNRNRGGARYSPRRAREGNMT